MGYLLNPDHTDYIEIIVHGLLDRKTAVAALDEVLSHPQYPVKHTLWNLTLSQNGLSVKDLMEIAGILKQFTPPAKHFANKSALLVKNRMEIAMVNLIGSAAAFLPVRYKTFLNFDKARAYLTSN